MADENYGAEAAGSAGMPQLDISTFGNQIFWLLIALAAIYLILKVIALPRIAGILSDRQGTITNDLAAAEDLKERAKQAEAAYEQALADARSEAQRIADEARAEIKAELDAAIAKADAQIAAKASESEAAIAEIRAGAVEAVKTVAKDIAKDIVKAVGASADARSVTAAVTAQMKG